MADHFNYSYFVLPAAFLVAVACLVFPWWTAKITGTDNNGNVVFEDQLTARPYNAGTSSKETPAEIRDSLDADVRISGFLTTFGIGALLVALGFHVVGSRGSKIPKWSVLVPLLLAMVFGVIVAVQAALQWPVSLKEALESIGASEDFAVRWFGETEIKYSNGGTTHVEYTPGAGWYLSFLAFLILPLWAAWSHYQAGRSTRASSE